MRNKLLESWLTRIKMLTAKKKYIHGSYDLTAYKYEVRFNGEKNEISESNYFS